MSGERQGEGEANLPETEEKTRSMFLDFMTKIAKFEELVDVGKRFLTRYHQELVYFKRSQLPKESNIVCEIFKSNYTDRMKSYLEAGSRLPHENIRNITQLHSCGQGLEDHIKKAKILLDELQCLSDDAYEITLAANISALEALKNNRDGGVIYESQSGEEERQLHQNDNSVYYVILMRLIHNMLKLDYAMQEKIVQSLSLETSPSELEGYCLMLDLRPYINDYVMRLAWNFIP